MCKLATVSLSLLLLAAGCGDDGPPSAHDGGVSDSGRADSSTSDASPPNDGGAADAGASGLPRWIDVHTHCGMPEPGCTDLAGCCTNASWQAARERFGGDSAVLLSTEHYAVLGRLGDVPHEVAEQLEQANERVAGGAAMDPSLSFFPSLECWYDTPFQDSGWVDACRADVDRWVAAGARGFKDQAGKQFDGEGRDERRWLGAWNRLNELCTVEPSTSTPNRDCMEQATVRYPALEDKWRQVLRYILEEVGLPVLSHTISYGDDDPCFDPMTGTTDGCGSVTKRALVELALWLLDNLTLEARRRFIAAHLGFLIGPVGDRALFLQLLGTGVSTETAANLGAIGRAGCEGRAAFAQFPDQLMFGTDRKATDGPCGLRTYEAWFHALTGDLGDERLFDTCVGSLRITGMQLGTPHVDGCAHDVAPDATDRFLRENFLRVYE